MLVAVKRKSFFDSATSDFTLPLLYHSKSNPPPKGKKRSSRQEWNLELGTWKGKGNGGC